MIIRKTTREDLDIVMQIYDHARRIMRESGNMKQWTNNYPNLQIIEEDMNAGCSWVLEDEEGIRSVFSLIPGDDEAYKVIEDGEWPNNEPYMTIHRIASAGTLKHAADICFDWSMERTDNLRIDTHEDNHIMHHVLKRNGFSRCGIIHIADGTPRTAYQKVK